MVRSPLHFHGRIPVPEVAPLTYRDGVTQLELVYELSQYLKNILHPSLQSTVDQVVADAEQLLSEANDQYVDGVQEFQRIHDRFMSDVNASLVALNDTAVTDLVDDKTSLLGDTLRRLIAMYGVTPHHAPPHVTTDGQQIQWAIDNATSYGGRVFLPPGNYQVDQTLTLPTRVQIVGSGLGETTITYSGDNALFAWVTPGSRKYENSFHDFTIRGPGKDTKTTGVLLDSVSSAEFANIAIANFGVGVNVHSPTNGFSVFNRFTNVSTNRCGTGFLVDGIGSNANVFQGCRANLCDIGFHISWSNNNSVNLSQIELCEVGVRIETPRVAGADQNEITSTRFEGNTVSYDIGEMVRATVLFHNKYFGSSENIDNGEQTTIYGGVSKYHTASRRPEGSFSFNRYTHGGDNTPIIKVVDEATATGNPVAIEAVSGRGSNGQVFRGSSAIDGEPVIDIDGIGNVKMYGRPNISSYLELHSGTNPPFAPSDGARIYVHNNALYVRFPNGVQHRIIGADD